MCAEFSFTVPKYISFTCVFITETMLAKNTVPVTYNTQHTVPAKIFQ